MSAYPYGYDGGLYLSGAFDTYGTLNLTQASPLQNFVEPISVQEMVGYLKLGTLDPNDPEPYNELVSFIHGARNQAEIMQDCDLVRKQWDLSFDYWTRYRIPLRGPLVSVDLVQYTDSTNAVHVLNPVPPPSNPSAPPPDYIVDLSKHPGSICPPYNGTWPTFSPAPSSALLIRFTSGYTNTAPFWSDAGARVKVGMKLLISHWYSNRLPFEMGLAATRNYDDYLLTSCLSYGAIPRAR